MEKYIGKTLLKIIHGNIIDQDTEAIVNAANSSLLGGKGVDGAIHRAGGPQIFQECKAIRSQYGELATGNAVITSGGKLNARYVIHAVGPVWFFGFMGEDDKLQKAYFNSLSLAKERGIKSISFPSISTGAYRFPVQRAAKIALHTVNEFIKSNDCFDEVTFILLSKNVYEKYAKTLAEINLI
jgi:O-acetyl-ADP-ribose deacetylase (regulator of RNase III)